MYVYITDIDTIATTKYESSSMFPWMSIPEIIYQKNSIGIIGNDMRIK